VISVAIFMSKLRFGLVGAGGIAQAYAQAFNESECCNLVAVADVFDALVSERPYKKAWPLEEGIEFLRSQRGRHFDPRCVDAFLADRTRIQAILEQFGD